MEHFAQHLQGWGEFQRLYASEVARAKSGDAFVEVGAWLGKSAAYMGVEILNSGKSIRLWCVDTFMGTGADYEEYPAVRDGKQLETFEKNIQPVSSVVKPLQADSVSAAKILEEYTFAFCFLDASHDYESVKSDLAAWWPKVKPGGHLAGHDYFYTNKRDGSSQTGVSRAVCEFVMEHKLDKLTLFLEQDCWLLEKT